MSLVADWTVDYGDGPRPCTVPHAWRQDVDVRWEGPAVYETEVEVVEPGQWLQFDGVSYHARVFLNGSLALEHRGIWDAFAVPLPTGQTKVRVEVTKNGGASFPVKNVLSGFLPYVFNTFGGIFREVRITGAPPPALPARGDGIETSPDLAAQPSARSKERAPNSRMSVEGTKLFIDGRPWYMRGVLSWGWYPDIGSPHPPIEVVRDEVRKIRALGFNLVKFCLWLPPHHYFQVLEEEDMWAWVELPLWMPSEEMDLELAFAEVERIVWQYRHHDRIVCWTCGCELSESTPHEFRKRLFEMVSELTGCPLVKDNSGGSEMYGGDLREYGTFYDFHPYCDTMFYPPVLESLQIGPRKKMPVLLGEFNDYDVYRPLGPLRKDTPYWASSDPALNDQGVRWQHDLPGVLADKTKVLADDIEEHLRNLSQVKSGWIRLYVTRLVAAVDDIAGYVVTGLSDTPISMSGALSAQCLENIFTDTTYFLNPYRMPPWINGGNRPGWHDPHNHFCGVASPSLGCRSVGGLETTLNVSYGLKPRVRIKREVTVPPNLPGELFKISHEWKTRYDLLSIVDESLQPSSHFSLSFFEPLDWRLYPQWHVSDPHGILGGQRRGGNLEVSTAWTGTLQGGIVFLTDHGTEPVPFWRECVTWNRAGEDLFDSWDFLFPVSTDRVIDPVWLDSELPGAEWLLTRVDTRTYQRHPYVARKGNVVVTTLRPWGGLGAQPPNFESNPAGHELMRILMRLVEDPTP